MQPEKDADMTDIILGGKEASLMGLLGTVYKEVGLEKYFEGVCD